MIKHMRGFAIAFLSAVVVLLAASPVAAQTPPAPTVGVLTTLTVKTDGGRDPIMKVMPEEVRVTLQMYLDGKILQMFGRADGTGVVFILNATTVAEAKALTDALPLSKAGLATFTYTALTPLTPFRMLLAPAPAK